MNIAIVGSEVVPFSKTGGLGDVVGALPTALAEKGHEVCVISPFYRAVRENADELGLQLEEMEDHAVNVPVGDFQQEAIPVRGQLPDSDVTVYFLKNDRYYDRPGLYTNPDNGNDYQDNSERFVFLCRGTIELLLELDLKPDILHGHDWQTGLVPMYLDHKYEDEFPDTASVFTVHNLAYQGLFWHRAMKLTGLSWDLFNWKMLEYYGKLSFLKGGLVGGDVLTTVSEQYAREIQTEEYGMGMHGVFQERANNLYGIVNGVDYDVWDPRVDKHIPENYGPEDLEGKEVCKESLQAEFDLPQRGDVPLIGMVGRLVEQKGIDLVVDGISDIVRRGMQLVVLGTGKQRYHEMLNKVAEKYPENVGVFLGFDEALAHRIEAGGDMFLMPSRFEPCGLNQLYSMRYGTIPVCSATGGLVDTVVNYQQAAGSESGANGFLFRPHGVAEMVKALDRAIRLYKNEPKDWRGLMMTGMRQDWSWERSAEEYVEVYQKAMEK